MPPGTPLHVPITWNTDRFTNTLRLCIYIQSWHLRRLHDCHKRNATLRAHQLLRQVSNARSIIDIVSYALSVVYDLILITVSDLI